MIDFQGFSYFRSTLVEDDLQVYIEHGPFFLLMTELLSLSNNVHTISTIELFVCNFQIQCKIFDFIFSNLTSEC